MSQHGQWGVIALVALLAACSQKSEEAEQPMPIEETVFADQVKALDSAKEQGKEMEGRMEDLNSQLDAAEGEGAGDSNPDGRRD